MSKVNDSQTCRVCPLEAHIWSIYGFARGKINNQNDYESSATAELARFADDVNFSVDDVHKT